MAELGKPPKKKIIGYKTTTIPGKEVVKGSTSVDMGSIPTSRPKKTYVPGDIVTGSQKYGKEGAGTYKPMVEALAKARAEKKVRTEPVKLPGGKEEGRYRAGEALIEHAPGGVKTTAKITPTMRTVEQKKTPIYAPTPTKKVGHLKPMAVTLGGSDKRGAPANKYGIGTPKRVKIRKVTSFPKR